MLEQCFTHDDATYMRACFKFPAQPYELMPQSSCLMVRDSEAGKGSVTCLG